MRATREGYEKKRRGCEELDREGGYDEGKERR